MYKLEWEPKAFRQLRKVRDPQALSSIKQAVASLANWPHCDKVQKVRTKERYRMKAGRWRIFFTVEEPVQTVIIEEVKRRDEHTY